MKKFDFLFKNVYLAVFCCSICLNLFTVTQVSANKLSPQQVLDKENEAQELSQKWSGETYRRSIQLFLEAAQNWSQLKEPSKSSECLRQAARIYLLLADYKNAKLQLTKAVALDEKNNNSAGRAKSLSFLSLIALEEDDRAKSESFYKQALEISKPTDDVAAKASALLSAAEYSYFYSDADSTVALYEEGLQNAEKSQDTRLLAQILLNLSYAYCKQGKPNSGLTTAQSALVKWQEIKDERGQAITYTAIGLAYKMLDEGQNALTAYFKSEALFPPDFDLIEQARLATGIASIYSNYNLDLMARNYVQKAYDLFQKAQYPSGQLAVLPSLIKLNYATGNTALAEKYNEEVKALSKKFKSDIILAYTNEITGSESLRRGFIEEAVNQYSLALQIFQKYKNKKGMALLYQRLGEAFERKGELPAAVENFNNALVINREIKDNFAESETLYQLARIDIQKENEANSLELVKNSITLTENLTSDIINTKLKSTYFSNVFDRYELYIHLLMKKHKAAPDENFAIAALQAAEKSRVRVMLENLSLSEANFTKDADAETVKQEKDIRVLLNAKADALTDLISQNADKSETDKVSNEIAELENQLENIRAKLKQQSPVYSAIKNPAPFDVGDFQHSILDDNSLLLEFSFGAQESYLWLIGKNEVKSYVLPPREEIESSIETLIGLLKERGLKSGEAVEDFQKRISEAETKYNQEAKELSRKLFGQVAEKLAKKRLIIVPDGELHYFPVAALPVPDSDEPILLTNETIYEPSAQTLAVLAQSRRQSAPAAKNLLVFSDPIFTTDDARFTAENKPAATETAQTEKFRFAESLSNLPRLSASKDESETIIETVGAENADSYSGFAATRDKLLNLKTEDYKILHFATHGLTNELRPELSGIVLSRFDEKGNKLNEFFRIQDIYALDLNADLVVLSACETGVGKEVKGEGLMSLNNAFLQTGAKAVMASLWKVEDGATLELMKNFYGAMANERLTPSQSLRQAQIKLRENPNYKSPFYWAAFTVQGDFRNVPKISQGFGFWVYLLPIVPLALFGIYLYRRKIQKPARS